MGKVRLEPSTPLKGWDSLNSHLGHLRYGTLQDIATGFQDYGDFGSPAWPGMPYPLRGSGRRIAG